MPVGITKAPDLPLARAPLMQAPHEGGQVGRVCARDLRGAREVLKAERLDGPRRVVRQDVTDPSLLGTGEHAAGYRSRTRRGGPAGRPFTSGRGTWTTSSTAPTRAHPRGTSAA